MRARIDNKWQGHAPGDSEGDWRASKDFTQHSEKYVHYPDNGKHRAGERFRITGAKPNRVDDHIDPHKEECLEKESAQSSGAFQLKHRPKRQT